MCTLPMPRIPYALEVVLPTETHQHRKRAIAGHVMHPGLACIIGGNIKPSQHSVLWLPPVQSDGPSVGSGVSSATGLCADTDSSLVCVQSPWDHFLLQAGGQEKSFWILDLKYNRSDRPLKVFDLANNFTSIFPHWPNVFLQ